MVPDAVLSAFVQAKGCREATREIAKVQEKLREATKDARLATAAVQRFGRLRGTAVLRVDASKAHAETAAATKAVSGFDGRRAVATLHVDSRRATEAVRENGRALDANGVAARRMVSAVASTGGAFAQSAESTRTASAATGEHAVMLLRAERAEHAVAAAKTAGVAADVGRRVAVQALATAEARYDKTMRDSTATGDQRQAATLALERAQVRLQRSTQAVAAADIRARQAAMGHASALHDMDAASRAAGGGGRDGGNGMRWFVASFADLPGRIYLSTRLLGALMNILMTMAPILVGVAAQLIAVVAALGPLIGLAAGAAGAMVAAAQGFGVFKLATMGVADALKEQMKVADGAGAAALTQAQRERSAAQAITAALEAARGAREGVRRASQALTEAQRAELQAADAMGPAYREATRWLRDLRDAQTSSTLSLREARFAAQDARQALRDLLAGPSPRVLADAHRDVTDALRGERDAARSLIDAQRDLNDLLAPPALLDAADAHDAVADATRDETRAQLALAKQVAATNATLADPGSSEADKATARLALADAENAVGDAARQSARAQERLRELEAGPTQDAIAQARQRVGDAEQAVARAKQDTIRAQEDLRAAESPASSDEIARARLAVAQAEHALSVAVRDGARASTDYARAQAAGIANAPALVAAREALRNASAAATEADRGLIEAQRDARLAAAGVGRAQQDAALSAQAAATATGNLSQKFDALPAPAQAFVRQLQAMKPRLDELRNTAAAGFFPGASEGLRAAAGSFDNVNRVVAKTSTVLGEAARKSGELVGSPAFGKDIEIIGGRNARVIDTLGEALRHVISAFRHVLVAAGPLMQWLADVANKWALNAAEAAKAGRESGRMADFFDRARETAQKLGSILSNLGSGLLGVGKASSATGRDILDSLDRITARFAEWANSARGRNEIAEFMERANEAMKAVGPALGALVSAFTNFAMTVLPAYAAILRVLSPVMDELVTIFIAWKIAVTGAAIATTAWKVAAAVATFVTGGWTTAFWALNAAMAANPIGLIVIAIAALVAGFILAYKNSETFRNIVDGALRAVADAFTFMWNAAQDVFGWLKDNWPLVLAILTGPIGLAVLAIREFGPKMLGAAKWLLDQFIAGVKAVAAAVVSLGGWIVARVVEGIKAIAGFASDVGGWLKNRIVDGVHAVAEAFKGLGGWVLNRIAEGFKVVGEALASVGGWLKNRVVEFVHNAAEGFVSLGGWVLNRIVDGIKVVTEALGSVGGWLKNRLVEGFSNIKDGFLGIGGSIMGWIVDGLKGGANLLIGFVNKIIDVINKIPGVDIGHIKKFAEGGVHGGGTGGPNGNGRTQAFAHGGFFGKTGGLMTAPVAIGGEEAPRFPEVVVPLNPAYRGRAQQLAAYAAQATGVPGFAEGGVIDAFRGAIKQTGAGPKASLALWMAGIVESGLRNLTWGDRDSLGALQVREGIHGRALAMNPFASAMAFLTRGFTGRGGAISLADNFHTAGQVAQAVQGSRFPDRYDAVRGQAEQYMKGGGGGGGLFSKITGAIGDLLSKGAGFILDKLPGVGDLPDWLKGTGKYVLDKAGDFIKDKVSSLVGGGGGELPGGVSGDIQQAIAFSRTIGKWTFGPGQLFRPGGTTYHGQGRAADFGDAGHSAAEMRQLYGALKARYGRNIKELFYDPMGEHVKNGRVVGSPFGGHGDHVHLALAQGGVYGPYGVLDSFKDGTNWVPRTGPYELHRGEAVIDRATNMAGGGDTFHVEIAVKGDGPLERAIADMIDVKIIRNGREIEAEMRAGVSP